MDIKLVDVVLHIDPNLDAAARSNVEQAIRALDGVVSVHMPENKPHLAMVEYNPDATSSQKILAAVTGLGIGAELVGL